MKPSLQEKKWIAAIKKSGRFDREFYRHWYGDDSNIGRNLEQHYITTGEMKGYWPSREFCPALYLDANPDVSEAGVSPFFHYVTSGLKEERFLRPQALSWNGEDEKNEFPKIDLSDSPASKKPYAVVVHIFHYEMWLGIAEKIDSLEGECDLFVTVTQRPDHSFDELSVTIKNAFPEAVIFQCPNHGRDILPFLRLINSGLLSDYRAVCKVHTKKSSHIEKGGAWSEHLLASLLPGRSDCRDLLERFIANKRCGILTADGQKKTGMEWWHGNRGRTLNLLARVGIPADPKQLCFPAGSMYWLKPKIVEALKRLQLCGEDFEPELGQGDGTTAHAVERVFGYLAESESLEVMEIGELMGRVVSEGEHQSYDFCETGDSCFRSEEGSLSETPAQPRRPSISRSVHYDGVLECCSPRGLVGWVRELSDREAACKILLTIDGGAVTEGFADQYRSDLGECDDVNAYCGFILPVPGHFFDGEVHGIHITVLGDAWLYRSLRFQTRLARMEEIGEVTEVSEDEVIGWCVDPLDPEFKQEVDLLIDGYFAGGTELSIEKEVGNGFRLEIPPSFRDGEKHDFKVAVRGSRVCLSNKGI